MVERSASTVITLTQTLTLTLTLTPDPNPVRAGSRMVKLNGVRVDLREVETAALALTGGVTFAMAVAVPVATQGVHAATGRALVLLVALAGDWPDAEAHVMRELRSAINGI